MDYVIDQVAAGAQHAGSKARDDATAILEDEGFSKRLITCSYNPDPISILRDTLSVPRQVKKIVGSFDEGSVFVLQFPFRCYSANLGRRLCRIARSRRAFSIALIHDLPSLRGIEQQPSLLDKTIRNDISFLKDFDCVIAHNGKMKQYLMSKGIESDKIVELELFDYLLPGKSTPEVSFAKKITVAGNLSPQKTHFLTTLQQLPEKRYDVDLFGTHWQGAADLNRVRYKGSFHPDEIASVIHQGFGLVWDGDSIDECSGDYGTYLLFNNPHKLSSYIACGVPVITWERAAVSAFVRRNNIGITVSSLTELNDLFDTITEREYAEMASNVSDIRSKIISGQYLRSAVHRAMERRRR